MNNTSHFAVIVLGKGSFSFDTFESADNFYLDCVLGDSCAKVELFDDKGKVRKSTCCAVGLSQDENNLCEALAESTKLMAKARQLAEEVHASTVWSVPSPTIEHLRYDLRDQAHDNRTLLEGFGDWVSKSV